MNKTMLVGVLATMAAVGGVAVAGKKKPKKVKSNVPAAMATLHKIVGEWKATGSATMGPDSTELEATLSCKEGSDGFAVICDSTLTLVGLGTSHETDVWGWDPFGKHYHWYSVTSMGEVHDHVADAPTGDTYEFVYSGAMDGGPGQEIIDLTFAADGKSIELASRLALDGQNAMTFQAKMTKQ